MSGEESLAGFARRALARRRVAERYRPHIDWLLARLEESRPAVDAVLEESMPNWRLERLAAIDRNILRIGTTELLYSEDVPGKVAIHEAVRLADRYGSDESPRFVNGVLDAVFHRGAPAGRSRP